MFVPFGTIVSEELKGWLIQYKTLPSLGGQSGYIVDTNMIRQGFIVWPKTALHVILPLTKGSRKK